MPSDSPTLYSPNLMHLLTLDNALFQGSFLLFHTLFQGSFAIFNTLFRTSFSFLPASNGIGLDGSEMKKPQRLISAAVSIVPVLQIVLLI